MKYICKYRVRKYKTNMADNTGGRRIENEANTGIPACPARCTMGQNTMKQGHHHLYSPSYCFKRHRKIWSVPRQRYYCDWPVLVEVQKAGRGYKHDLKSYMYTKLRRHSTQFSFWHVCDVMLYKILQNIL